MSDRTENESPEIVEAQGAQIDQADHLLRLVIDIAPLLTFFGLYFLIDKAFAENLVGAGHVSRLILATGGYMIVTIAAVTVAYVKQKRLAPMPLLTTAVVLVFGGLTVILQNDAFIKMKPTIINLLFASILTVGLLTNRPFMRHLFGEVFSLTDRGWRILTIRWVCFFVFLAALNEVIWRNFPEEFWVSFKVFGVMPLTVVFSMLQIPFVAKHAPDDQDRQEHSGDLS